MSKIDILGSYQIINGFNSNVICICLCKTLFRQKQTSGIIQIYAKIFFINLSNLVFKISKIGDVEKKLKTKTIYHYSSYKFLT